MAGTNRSIFSFIYIGTPRSYQSQSKNKYQGNVRAEFLRQCPGAVMQAGASLYCNIYYFHREPFSIDADNISKPVVDCLRGHAYSDDDLIKFRAAGKIDLGHYSITELDLTNVPAASLPALVNAINVEKHFLFIEVGTFDLNDFVFGRTI